MHMKRGFTLVELSIVIVIIALIMAGIFATRSLIEAAEARAIIGERNIYTTAFKEFTDKYQAIPGDMNNAESIWGSDTSGGGTCPAIDTNTDGKTATCNGDGDGMIGNWTNGSTSDGTEYEWFRAWQHLANSEIIEGWFTGVSGTASTEASLGFSVPQSKTARGGWTMMWMASTTDNNFFFASVPVASHALIYGRPTASSFTDSPVLSAIMTKSIDTKVDDGMPFTGKLRAKRSNSNNCAVTALVTVDYMATSAEVCQLIFLMGV